MAVRERFVPRRVGELVPLLAERAWAGDDRSADFRAFARLVAALFHYRFHDRELAAVDAWERVTVDQAAAELVTGEIDSLLERANYTPVTVAELDEAMTRESLVPLRIEVDVGDYEELLIRRRGSRREEVEVPRWWGLRSERRTVTVDERVVVHAQVRSREWFEAHDRDPAERDLDPGHVSLKQFQNVPRADIETLLPTVQVRFRPIDTLAVGLPALASGIAVVFTKLLPTIGLIALLIGAWLGVRDEEPTIDQAALVILLGGAVTLGSFVFRQWTKLKNRRVEYLKTLTENLYFRTLGDGPGVIHTLLASAEEQEVLEVLLGYRFLLEVPDGRTRAELDGVIEEWLATTCNADVDFEVDDAVAKLRDLDLVEETTGGRLRPVPLVEALARLDRRWDAIFRH